MDDVLLSGIVPFVVYWLTAVYYDVILNSIKAPWLDKYRMHTEAHQKQFNLVSKRKVVLTVLAQHATQMLLAYLFLEQAPDVSQRTYLEEFVRFLGAVLCMDAWQFAFHRLFHEVEWLYQKVHIWHHLVYVPYASAALYQHPFEMLVMDTLSGMVAVSATGCSPRTAMLFWSLSYFKTVSDHSNYKFPLNPANMKGWNNAFYHDVHHSPTGIHLNYAQPYFTFWDRVYGCFKDPADGEALPSKKVA